MVMSQENLRDAPYVKFLSPDVGACVAGEVDLKVAWMLVITGHESDAAAFRAQHGQSEVCIALGSEGPETCVGALSGHDLWLTGGLPPGCHTLVGWWRAASGRPGSATSVPFSAGPSCHAACNQTISSSDPAAGDGTASTVAAAPRRAALGFPPNAVTGGCLAEKDADTEWSRARGGQGGGCRCTEGCCEAGSPLSMCEHFAFDAWHNSGAAADERAAPGGKLGTQAAAGRSKRLPLCSECLPEVSPPDRELLPRFSTAAPLVRRYLNTVKATVLNLAYTNFDDADFDSLQVTHGTLAQPFERASHRIAHQALT
jgi:hypothetical protein